MVLENLFLQQLNIRQENVLKMQHKLKQPKAKHLCIIKQTQRKELHRTITELTAREIKNRHIMTTRKTNEIWIGLFGVSGSPSNIHLNGCPGAYVTVLTNASDEECFKSRVLSDTKSLGLHIDEIMWCMTLKNRLLKYDIEDYLQILAKEVKETDETRFGIFHAWEAEE